MSAAEESTLTVELPDEAATAALAEDIAAGLAVGDIVALSGGLGAGKTTFARALLRALAGDPDLEVPSPTFTLVQTYAVGRLTVAHFDLYRISGIDELDEIGLADAAKEGVVLVEWPERAGNRLPAERLSIVFTIAGSGRRATVSGEGAPWERFQRSRAARALVEAAGWSGATRRVLEGDASTRTYERVRQGARSAVLMDWPSRGQLTAGDPRAVFRARDARAFVAVDAALRAAGLSAPEIQAADVASGLLLLEDFGTEGLIVDGAADVRRYRVAIEALAAIHVEPRPPELPLPGGGTYRLPHLRGEALLAEISIFADWYAPLAMGAPLADVTRAELVSVWRSLGDRLAKAEQSWVLFDIQSPNLFWLAERSGIARIGIIDFQDMFFGPSAYDVASLCHDARISISPAMEEELVGHYVALRRAADAAFDADSFHAAFAICAALRSAKNMGAFVRLAGIGNPIYLKHLSRLRAYLRRALSHPVLSPFAVWYERHLPPQDQAVR